MVDITPLIGAHQQLIQSYGAGGFRINGQRYDGAVLVFPDRTDMWAVDGAAGLAGLCADDFAPLVAMAADIDVLLLGSGRMMGMLDPTLRRDLRAAGLVVDVMDTGAACRTYNVLMAEGRRVAASLFPV